MKIVAKVEIERTLLADICEIAYGSYEQKLAGTERLYAGLCLLDSLANVMQLSEAAKKFAENDKLILTIEKREEQE